MYGMIHVAARQMATEALGADRWDDIIRKSGLTEEHFISGYHYDDGHTYALIDAVASEMNLEHGRLLNLFGHYWVHHVSKTQYSKILSMVGRNLTEFLSNINRMHDSLSISMPNAILPKFDLIRSEENLFIVEYISPREGLLEFVSGLLAGLLDHFELDGTVSYNNESGSHIFKINIK